MSGERLVLLSAFVHAGHIDDNQAHTAFDAAASGLPLKGMELLLRDGLSTAALESSAIHLSNVITSDKRSPIPALAQAVEHDGFVTVIQGELLRAIADSQNCPLYRRFLPTRISSKTDLLSHQRVTDDATVAPDTP